MKNDFCPINNKQQSPEAALQTHSVSSNSNLQMWIANHPHRFYFTCTLSLTLTNGVLPWVWGCFVGCNKASAQEEGHFQWCCLRLYALSVNHEKAWVFLFNDKLGALRLPSEGGAKRMHALFWIRTFVYTPKHLQILKGSYVFYISRENGDGVLTTYFRLVFVPRH